LTDKFLRAPFHVVVEDEDIETAVCSVSPLMSKRSPCFRMASPRAMTLTVAFGATNVTPKV
jgi:hypothetical protein